VTTTVFNRQPHPVTPPGGVAIPAFATDEVDQLDEGLQALVDAGVLEVLGDAPDTPDTPTPETPDNPDKED
jgi:hypothetical protein